jgi:methionine salvage enolase-phosphatase E1
VTIEKVKEVVERYRDRLSSVVKNAKSECMSERAAKTASSQMDWNVKIAHYLFMCDQIVSFVESGNLEKKEKATRWLGFLQGAIWSDGFYTLNELKDHSR